MDSICPPATDTNARPISYPLLRSALCTEDEIAALSAPTSVTMPLRIP